jgi:hypothetical protein
MADEGRDNKGRFTKGNNHGFAGHPEWINRKGRPPGVSLTDTLMRVLADDGKNGGPSGESLRQALVQETIKEALRGSFQHLKEIWTRVDGKDTSHTNYYTDNEPSTAEEHQQAAIEVCRAIITDPASVPRDRLAAQAEINRMLGFVADGTAVGTPEEIAERVRRALQEMEGQGGNLEDTTPTQETD